jgi:protein-L-isoaspartate(D-aspartate) O-methyltransferase
MTTMDFKAARIDMVKRQISARGIRDAFVLEAMRTVPREVFLPPSERELAYGDTPLPIGADQTISQPYIVAFMIEALGLTGGETVLEIGTGSGYAAAVLSRIAANVYSVERMKTLARKAVETLASLFYDNVHILQGDGTLGWQEHAPFDAIIVSAGGPRVPEPLKTQLKVGGRMVIPVGSRSSQQLFRVTRDSDTKYTTEVIADVRFVPLIGAEGWESEA